MGCSHIATFIAGARISGFPDGPKFQARTIHDNVSSHNPFANLANECADNGATTHTVAQSRRTICSTGSPILSHTLHSSALSLKFGVEIRFDMSRK